MTWLAIVLGLLWLLVAVHDVLAVMRLPPLPAVRSVGDEPAVTVVVAVRDDRAHAAELMQSLLAQRGVRLSVVAVDDRSSDGTGDVLARFAAADRRATVVIVRELPPDWLGKSHALHTGAANVTTPWLLFTDGDARLHADAIAQAVAAAESAGADHLCLLPTHRDTTFLGRACLLAFHLQVLRRVAAVNSKRQRGFVGTGAFNLVRTAAYRAIGGHVPLRLEVVDDVFLGALLSRGGYRTRVLFAPHALAIDWGGTPVHLLRVLEKNLFAALRYRTALALAAVGVFLGLLGATFTAPLWDGTRGWFVIVAYLAGGAAGALLARAMQWNVLAGLLAPIARIALPLAVLNSTWVTLRQGGVRWRGTFYPLAQLRAGQVRLH